MEKIALERKVTFSLKHNKQINKQNSRGLVIEVFFCMPCGLELLP